MKKPKNNEVKKADSSKRIQKSDGSIIKKQIKKKDSLTVRIPKTLKDCDTNWKILLSQLKQERNVTVTKNKPRKLFKQHSTNVESDIWFDDVELEDIISGERDSASGSSEASSSTGNGTDKALVKPNAFAGLTKVSPTALSLILFPPFNLNASITSSYPAEVRGNFRCDILW